MRFLKALIAVVLGNAIYFLVLYPYLPEKGRHQPYRPDLGLLIDFWICLVTFGVIEVIIRLYRRRASR